MRAVKGIAGNLRNMNNVELNKYDCTLMLLFFSKNDKIRFCSLKQGIDLKQITFFFKENSSKRQLIYNVFYAIKQGVEYFHDLLLEPKHPGEGKLSLAMVSLLHHTLDCAGRDQLVVAQMEFPMVPGLLYLCICF